MVKRKKYPYKGLALIMGLTLVTSLIGCTKTPTSTGVATSSEATKVVITDESQLNAVADIKQKLNYMYENGANLRLVMSDDESDDWYLMYNNTRDCYAEMTGGGAVVYRPNGDRTVFTSEVTQGKDLDPLAIIGNMVSLAEEGIATIEVSKVDSITGLEINNEAGNMGKEVESIVNSKATSEADNLVEETSESVEDIESLTETGTSETEASESIEETSESIEETSESIEETSKSIEETSKSEESQQEKGIELNQYVITLKGVDNIKKIYSKTLNESEADEILGSILLDNLTNKESDKSNYLYKLTVNTKDDNAISARLTLTMDGTEYIGWWFDGYIDIGNWSLPDEWDGTHTEEEWVELYNKLKENIQAAIDKYAKDNFTEEQINNMQQTETIEETSPDLAETKENVEAGVGETVGNNENSDDNETIEAADPTGYVASINRDGSFNDKVQALLKEDGISEDDIESFEIPSGYTQEDKDKMVELYNTIKEWDKDQATGVLVSPIGMTDIDFINEYINACKDAYNKDVKSSEIDKYGAIFWEDTLGTFIKMLK